jgi:hypothetical protein
MGFISTSHGFARIHADKTIRRKISDLSALIKFGDAEESQGLSKRGCPHRGVLGFSSYFLPKIYQS